MSRVVTLRERRLQPDAPPRHILFSEYHPRRREAHVIQRELMLRGGAQLRVAVDSRYPALLRVTCRLGGEGARAPHCLDLLFRYAPADSPFAELEAICARGLFADDSTVAGLRVGRRYAPGTIERLVAAGYAHLRGEAARIDRARGFAYGFTQNRLAHDWRHPEVSRVWRPDPCLPGGRPDSINPNEKR